MTAARAAAAAIAMAITGGASGCARAPVSQSPGRTAGAAEPAGEQLAIAIYAGGGRAFAVVDERRAVEVHGGAIRLERIPLDVSLAALVIEAIEPSGAEARGAFSIDACARPRLSSTDAALDVASPIIECAVTGAPGRHLVRVHYATSAIAARAQHQIALAAPDRATISTRFAIPTPAWGLRAEVVVHDGAPGSGAPPREQARGAVALDGSIAILASPAREVPARVVHVFDGMRRGQIAPATDAAWGRDSQRDIRAVLELDGARLRPAPAHVAIALGAAGEPPHEVTTAYAPAAVDAPAAAATSQTQRIPLWIDPVLRGSRRRSSERRGETGLADRVELAIANTGTEPREVWIEEPLRPVGARAVARAHPAAPALARGIARTKLLVDAGATARTDYTIVYRF